MNSPKFTQKLIGAKLAIMFFAGSGALAATPVLLLTFPPPPPTSASPMVSTSSSLFRFVKSVQVAPFGNQSSTPFVRIGYVPGRNGMVVTFDTMLTQPEGSCTTTGYAWKEYTTDMTPTGSQGLINCYGGIMDTGGLFIGNDFYFAYQTVSPTVPSQQGWILAKYDTTNWVTATSYFFPLGQNEDPGDPMIAPVNGVIDISSKIQNELHDDPSCPFPEYVDCWTHHYFFTMDLAPIPNSRRVLTDTPHINLSSMIQTADGIINFLTSTRFLKGEVIVMRYDSTWNPLPPPPAQNWITLIPRNGDGSSQTEGFAFDGNRFYVSYIYYKESECPNFTSQCTMNVRLAAFDTNWKLLDDIAVTNVPDFQKAARPSLTLRNGRLYVSYDLEEQLGTFIFKAYVSVYDLNTTYLPLILR